MQLMSHIYKTPFGGQAGKLYKIILKYNLLSAKELAKKMKITRHSIYRLTNYLLEQGLIEASKSYPARFSPVSVDNARRNFLMKQSDQLTSLFSSNHLNLNVPYNSQKVIYDLSFFKSREEHMVTLINDVKNAQKSIKHSILVLPVGIPPELMLEFAGAVKRGVELKIIAQEYGAENLTVLNSYKHIGAILKHDKTMNWHLFLIDDHISYISMYNPENKISQTGARFVHPGINRELSMIFEKYWNEAEEI